MPGTYISPAETGLYYVSSRYYDPEIGRFINADGYVSTGQGATGFNMFAYCGNNPVNRKDQNGLSSTDIIAKGIIAIISSAIDGYLPIGDIVAICIAGVIVAEVAPEVVETTSTVVSKATEKLSSGNHSVYVLKDDEGTVQYVGRTTDVEKRALAHKANPHRSTLHMDVVASDLNYFEARALEQAGMAYYHTINTANKMNNQINGISPKYWEAFKEFALGCLRYNHNRMTNEILYWTEG